MVRLLQILLRFYHHESCGQCTPCREGMGWMHRIIDRIVAGEGQPGDIDQLIRISKANDGTTICGMGDAAGYATVGIIAKYRDEFEYFIEHKRSRLRRPARSRRWGRHDRVLHQRPAGPGRGQPDRHAGGQGERLLHPLLLLAPAPVPPPTPHPSPPLSVPGNCRICMVEVEAEGGGGGWLDIACNMPITKGMRVLTDSDKVRARRKETLQFITLNHPVDCGICDKAGECTLQDYHYEYNGSPSVSRDAKVHATKHFPLSERIVLDNERCIMCTRCVRFTREISKTARARRAEPRRPFADPPGRRRRASRTTRTPTTSSTSARWARCCRAPFLHKARVWYLEAHAVGLPGLRARLQRQHLASQERVEAEGARPEAERAHRPRHAAREPGRQRPVDLQQGPRPGADLRARARRAGDAQGPAGRAAGRDRQRPRADRRGEAAGGAGVELGLERGTRGVPARRSGARFSALRQDRLAGRAGRAARRRSADQARQEPEHAPRRARCSRAARRRARGLPAPTPTWCWSGAKASASRSCRPRREDHLPEQLPAARERPRRRVPADQRADRAQRPLHQLPGRGQRVRGLLREEAPAWPMPRPCSPRWPCRQVEASS